MNIKIYIVDYTSNIYGKNNNFNYERIGKSHQGIENNPIRDLRGNFMEIDKRVQEKDLRYRDKDWLYDQYVNQKKSSIQIGNICRCHKGIICRWLNRFNISIRKDGDAQRNYYIQGNNTWNKGISHSEETKKRISNAKRGKKLSEEHKGKFKEGHIPWNKGKENVYSNEVLTKMSEKKIGKNKREKNPNWKGGKRYTSNRGYVHILKDTHYRAEANRGYVLEHILIMEKYLKRQLWDFERVHHINEIKDDNRIENLYLCKSNSHHRRIHTQLEKVAIELYRSQKFGKIQFDREKGKYYIIWQNGDEKK